MSTTTPPSFKQLKGSWAKRARIWARRICEMYRWSVHETGEFGQGVRFVMTIPNNLSNIKVMHLEVKQDKREHEEDLVWR